MTPGSVRNLILLPLVTSAFVVGLLGQCRAQNVPWPSVPNLESRVALPKEKSKTSPRVAAAPIDDKKLDESFKLPKFGSRTSPRQDQPLTKLRSVPQPRHQPFPRAPQPPQNGQFDQRASGKPASMRRDTQTTDPVVVPRNATPHKPFVDRIVDPTVSPWWSQRATKSFTENHQSVTPELLIMLALKSSPRLRAISREPMVREYAIDEAKSRFDPEAFLDTQFDDRNDPVGNQLTTGGLPFLEDHTWYAEGGFRQKFYTGGDVEVSQKVGFQNSNSRFFDPQDQGTSTLFINFTQPLMRGRGRVFNRSQIVIAELNTNIAWEKYVLDLQAELEAVVNAYWNLYYTRSVWLQKQNNVNRGQAILNILEKRRDLDSTPSQIARARAAVLLRKTELANARRDIQNAETEINRLIGTIRVGMTNTIELVPSESPNFLMVNNSPEQVASDALHHRPEIREAFQRAKVTSVQLEISKNELMPELSLLLGTYFSALEGDSGVFRALQRQYSETTPGYYAGLKFKYPLRNRAAKSRRDQTAVRLARVQDEIDQISQTVISESQVALRRLDSAYQTLKSAAQAIKAAEADLKQQNKRWEAFGLVEGDLSEGQNPTTILDQLLDAQQRLANAELTFSRAELEFKAAEIGLRRVTGKLLQHQKIEFGRTGESPTRIEPQRGNIPTQQSGEANGDKAPGSTGFIRPDTRPFPPTNTDSNPSIDLNRPARTMEVNPKTTSEPANLTSPRKNRSGIQSLSQSNGQVQAPTTIQQGSQTWNSKVDRLDYQIPSRERDSKSPASRRLSGFRK